jgi:hypothetical protein
LKTQENNDENQGVKWKYDIVAKATSDTIWDWKIQEDNLLEQRNKSIFGYENIRLATVQNGGLIIYIPTIKMSIKLYSFIEQNWQLEMNTAVLTTPINTYLTEFLLKDENGKAIRMIRAIQDITKQKRRAAT